MNCCLIGEKLSHSYSSEIHNFSDINYSLEEVKRPDLKNFLKSANYQGYNITIPYKEIVIPYLDYIDKTASEIGSVNTILKKNGKLYGYNTDISGFSKALELNGINVENKTVAVLGSGGTSKTVCYYLKEKKAKKIYVVSRNGEINYSNYNNKINDAEILINATPVGSFPKNEKALVNLKYLKKLKFVFDCVYNPFRTDLLLQAEKLKIKYSNGLTMLIFQAFFSEVIWGKINEDETVFEKILSKLNKKKNIVLIGMPSCGKSTVGKQLAKKLNMPFFDSDDEIEKTFKKSIPDYIKTFGEKSFREVESKTIYAISQYRGAVISVGGGVVLNEENINNLKQNGIIYYIKRKNKFLTTKNRPISQEKTIKKIFKERKKLYYRSMDFCIENNDNIENCIKKVITHYEDTCSKWC